jgi:predicted RNA methylase
MKDKKTQKELGQFFTPSSVAESVTRHAGNKVGSVIDLAAGVGDLLIAACSKYSEASISAIDIDPESVANLKESFPNGDVVLSNSLFLKANSKKWIDSCSYDLVVGNPPYNKQKVSDWTIKVIQAELGLDCSKHSAVRAEIAFLALSLRSASVGGCVSLVLPKTIICGESWQWLRSILIKKHSLIAVSSLPSNVFQNTEVETCIITLRKGRTSRAKIKLINCDKSGNSIGEIKISPKDGVYRLDFEYHLWCATSPYLQNETISQTGAQMVRGNIYAKKAKDLGIEIFHTSSFTEIDKGIVHFRNVSRSIEPRLVSVGKGDILIPRVGRNLNQMAIVGSGESIISDCVFGLTIPPERLSEVRETLDSDHAKVWIKVNASGACAKLLSKSSLLNMPLLN